MKEEVKQQRAKCRGRGQGQNKRAKTRAGARARARAKPQTNILPLKAPGVCCFGLHNVFCVGILEKLSAKLVGPNQLALENGKYKIKFRRDHVEFRIFVFRRDHVTTKWDEGWVVNVHIG